MSKVEPSLDQIHYIVLPLIRRAGQMLVSRQKTLINLNTAERHKRETEIQAEIRNFLCSTLIRLFPNHAVKDFDYKPEEASGYQWIVTELDGRRFYTRGLPLYTTALALVRDNEVVLGIVFEPANDLAYHALRGQGAFAGNQPLKTSEQVDAPKAAIYLESPVSDAEHKPAERFKIWQSFAGAGCRIFDLGLPSLGLCYVAAGAFDVLIGGPNHPTFINDYAAALLIAKEAGAVISDDKGKDISSLNPSLILAATKPIHKTALTLLK
jgi:myo-inositol-1(or 4)-monophosphatase